MSSQRNLAQGNKAHDRVMLISVILNVLLAAGLGYANEHLTMALAWGLPIIVACVLLRKWQGGQTPAKLGLALANVALVVIQTLVSPSSLAVHSNVFVCLSLLLPYGDWRPVALTGVAFAVFELYGMSVKGADHPGWAGDTWLDLGFLIGVTALMAVLARRMKFAAAERFELEFLINAMGREGPIRLNLDVVRAESEVAQRLKHVQSRMASTLKQVRHVIFSVHSAAQEMAASSTELKGRTERTATELRDAAMSLEQINVIVQASAEASKEARALSTTASDMATQGGQVVTQVVRAMQEIDTSSRRITDIIGVIDTIAFQTNILALNAAVEAARAGDQGRGFAVVAAEVRMLAKRSSEAAKEIKTLISDSMQTVERGTRLADEAGQAMDGLVAAVKRVGAVFDTLTADSSEHAQGIDVVTSSVRDLDEVTRQNVSVADRSGDIAYELQVQAAALAEVLGSFRLGDDAAMAELRQAAQDAVNSIQQQRAQAQHKANSDTGAAQNSGVDFF